MQAEAQVMIRGKVFLYREKAPFIPSGMSVRGALEFNEADQTVRCHECGDWFPAVGRHIKVHGITAAEYKLKHGFRACAALVSESVRGQLIKQGYNGKTRLMDPEVKVRAAAGSAAFRRSQKGRRRQQSTEVKNEDGRCHAQLIETLRAIATRVGHTPSIAELKEGPLGDNVDGISHTSLLMSFNVRRLSDVMKLLGLPPNALGGPVKDRGGKPARRPAVFTASICVDMLKAFFAEHHRLPSASDKRRGLFPNHMTTNKIFGSMRNFYAAAGLSAEGEAMRLAHSKVATTASAAARKTVSSELKSAWAVAGHASRKAKAGVLPVA